MKDLTKFQFVDEARGVAILLVILFHSVEGIGKLGFLSLPATYGQMGVELFFVASAFSLSHSFRNRSGESHGAIAFYIRRFFRIAPMFYVGIVIYGLLHFYMQHCARSPLSWDPYTPRNVLANALFLHGFYPPAYNNIVAGG